MTREAIVTPLADQMPGVSGEFHTQGQLSNAAKTARRHGFPLDRMWYIGDPSTDYVGEPMGLVAPVSYSRECAVAGALLGLLIGTLCAFLLPPGSNLLDTLTNGLARFPAVAGGATVAGFALGWYGSWVSLAGRLNQYLQNGTGGALRLKIGIPNDLPQTEQERLAELAERALREAHAESLLHLDGSREVNSPQSANYIP